MKKVDEKVLYKGNWMTMRESTFLGKDGSTIQWESFHRNHKNTVIVIIARLIPSNRYILIRQFRPAVEKWVLGFPAGIVDTDNHEEQALKELKEETGYTGTITSCSPALKSSPASMNVNMYIALADVDEKDTINQNPVQSLEPEEEIEVLLVTKDKMREFALKEKEQGTEIGAMLWLYML